MTEAYRHKLLHWFISMLTILTACTLNALIFWFRKIPNVVIGPDFYDVSQIAGLASKTLFFYPIYFVIFSFWHFFDFWERSPEKTGFVRRTVGYCYFFCLLALTMLLHLLMETGIFSYNSCDELEGAFYLECLVGPPLWLLLPWIGGVGLALILTIANGVYAIKSHLTKAP